MVETDSKFEIALVMPEDNLILSATTAENKMEWFVNLQKCILNVLGKWWEFVSFLKEVFTEDLRTLFDHRSMPCESEFNLSILLC